MGWFREYRRRRRSARMAERLAAEGRDYRRRFAAQGLTLPGPAAIGERLRRRYPGRRPSPKGDLRIIAVFHHYNWERDALLPSLSAFGRVRHYDWADAGVTMDGRDWFARGRADMNRDLRRRVTDWCREERPDVIFTYLSGEQITPDTGAWLQRLQVPTINIYLNDKENFVGKIRGGYAAGMRDICRYFDLCWTSTRDALEKYCVAGATPVYLPEGANPAVHRPYDVPRDIPVSFVGQCYGRRPEMVAAIAAAGIPVAVYGSGWANGPLSTEDMVRMYSRSDISLGFSGVADMAGAYCLKGRDFEVPMSGGLYLTENHPELGRWFTPGEEIETYTDASDLIEKIRRLLDAPDRAAAIRRAGRRRALAEHSWEKRFETVFGIMGLCR